MSESPLHPSLPSLSRLRLEEYILWEDAHVLLLNKPPGYPTLAERNRPETGILHWIRQYRPQLRVCHRLDKQTSGVLLFAQELEGFRQLVRQFEYREVQKDYLTLIEGSHNLDNIQVEVPIGRAQQGLSRVDFEQGKPAVTLIRTEKAYRHYSLLRCRPLTGRPHQIRVHLAYLQCPILGDEAYGGGHLMLSRIKRKYKPTGDAETEERPLERGLVLHAQRLQFLHPGTGAPMAVEAPPSENLKICLKVLEKYDAL